MQIPKDATINIESFISRNMLNRLYNTFKKETQLNKCVSKIVDFLENKEIVNAATFIEIVIPCLSPDMFVLTKKLKVVK